ncbi:hypothetical protein K469DRAFT_598026, partial [Zopfia rhizophila CBS 207.26]
FIKSENSTKKLKIIKALKKLFINKEILYYLLITVTLGTVAVRINNIIIHLTYSFSKGVL